VSLLKPLYFLATIGLVSFGVTSPIEAQQSGLAPATPPPAPDHTTVSPGMITPGSIPGTPNPPHNPSQQPLPSAPGVIVTIPIGRK
jgi:hypothetical protein